MSKKETILDLHDELTKTFLFLVKAARNPTPTEDGQITAIIEKGHAGILKEAREWLKQNGVEKPLPKPGDPLHELSDEVEKKDSILKNLPEFEDEQFH
jgi:hypothetical protein